ncbi:MAG: hypothetical protein WAV41_02970 [Microgenomates group bacterium]
MDTTEQKVVTVRVVTPYVHCKSALRCEVLGVSGEVTKMDYFRLTRDFRLDDALKKIPQELPCACGGLLVRSYK